MDVYADLEFPPAPEGRPVVYINMVSTIDGKTVTGTRADDVRGLGSAVDRRLMKRIERSADAVLVGAQTLRATSPLWNPGPPIRVVVSRSGNLPQDACFFTGGSAYIVTGAGSSVTPGGEATVWTCGDDAVEMPCLLARLRTELSVRRLVVMGGSELNAALLEMDLVDELFLTIAPKIKLGRNVPGYAGGNPLPRDQMQDYRLVEHHAIVDEIFLRYRRNRP